MRELTELGRTDVPSLYVLNSPEYKQYATQHHVEDFTAALAESWKLATAEHWPFYPQFAKIGDTFSQNVSAAIAGTKTVPAAMTETQQQLNEIMKDSGYLK